MKSNYPYPKDEIEFYARQYSIDQLVKYYEFDTLMAYYLFGMNSLKNINMVIENKLFDVIGQTPFKVEQDKVYYIVRTNVIKKAMEKLNVCSVLICDDKVIVTSNN